ncbi:uncharacterized protein G2W53_024717 [Senna tora]|uniref:Uncharacterized protein n=1 Tax=Senna tora TaxID=362788 RepID=A0A834WE33_9FABA|nr:uncharacterized protein G2W53_024717 [Senna tora]
MGHVSSKYALVLWRWLHTTVTDLDRSDSNVVVGTKSASPVHWFKVFSVQTKLFNSERILLLKSLPPLPVLYILSYNLPFMSLL